MTIKALFRFPDFWASNRFVNNTEKEMELCCKGVSSVGGLQDIIVVAHDLGRKVIADEVVPRTVVLSFAQRR